MQPGLFNGLPDPEGPLAEGVRSLRSNQYDTTQIEPGSVIRGMEEMRAVVGDALRPEGTHTDTLSGLFSYVRQGGKAGFQGFTRNPLDRPSIVIRNFNDSSGEVIAAIDPSRVDQARVFDFRSPAVRDAFLARYPAYRRQVNILGREGVVAIQGEIVVESLTGLVRIPKTAEAAAIRAVVLALAGGR